LGPPRLPIGAKGERFGPAGRIESGPQAARQLQSNRLFARDEGKQPGAAHPRSGTLTLNRIDNAFRDLPRMNRGGGVEMQPIRTFLPCAALLAMTFSALAAPDEDLLGKKAGYPIGTPFTWFYDERVRVGSFSNLDKIVAHNTLKRAVSPAPLQAGREQQFEYRFDGRTYTVDDFLARQRITGLLLIKNGEVLLERYQYDRNAANRFLSNSMAKSIVSLAVGMALDEKKIASLDDTVSKYEPRLGGSLYGETSIRNLLRMSSGVKFIEDAPTICGGSRRPATCMAISTHCAHSRFAKPSKARAFTTPPAKPWCWLCCCVRLPGQR
jgi:Beta-lactamase